MRPRDRGCRWEIPVGEAPAISATRRERIVVGVGKPSAARLREARCWAHHREGRCMQAYRGEYMQVTPIE